MGIDLDEEPAYRDVLYVEELIGPGTVNTMPPETIRAFQDHGRVEPTLERDVDEAHRTFEAFADAGVDYTTSSACSSARASRSSPSRSRS